MPAPASVMKPGQSVQSRLRIRRERCGVLCLTAKTGFETSKWYYSLG